MFEYELEVNDVNIDQFDGNKQVILDLLVQTLDPCGIITAINPQSFEKDVIINVESTITQNVIIYYNNSDITSKFSQLLNGHTLILADFIEKSSKFIDLLTYGDDDEDDNYDDAFVFNLFDKSLYVSKLILLSLSIPSETFSIGNDKIDTYAVRLYDKSLHKTMMVQNDTVSILIPKNNTIIGRSSFANYFDSLNSVDLVISAFDNSNKRSYNNCNISNSSIIFTDYVSVVLLSDSVQLSSNITFVFSNNVDDERIDDYNYDKLECVWLNWTDSTWSSDGCAVLLGNSNGSINSDDDDSLSCSCSHLTTFGILRHIDDFEDISGGSGINNPFWREYSNNLVYGVVLILLIFGFISVVCFSFGLLYKLCKNKITLYSKRKPFEAAFGALFFILVDSIAQIASCALFLSLLNFIPNSDSVEYNFSDSQIIIDILIECVTLSLFLPIVTSFYIFSCVIYGLSIVSNSLSSQINTIRENTFKLMIWINIFITLLFLSMSAILIADVTDLSNIVHSTIFTTFECIYLLLILIVIVLSNYFSFGAIQVIQGSIEMVKADYQAKFDVRTQTAKLKVRSREPSREPSVDRSVSTIRMTHTSTSTNTDLDEIEIVDSDNAKIKTLKNNMNKDLRKRYIAQKRMLISTMAISILLLIEILSIITFLINYHLLHPIMHLCQIFLNLVYLIVTLKLYLYYIQARIDQRRREIS